MMHTLGFFHTSSRTDRDAYVTIYDKNIKSGSLVVCFIINTKLCKGMSGYVRICEVGFHDGGRFQDS